MSFFSKLDFYTTNCDAYEENISWRFISALRKCIKAILQVKNELWRVNHPLHPCIIVRSGLLGVSVFSAGVFQSCMCVSVSIALLCVSAWGEILSCVYPQCVCSLGHGTSACMPSIRLGEGGVVVVGLSIFHVLLACLFPPNNSHRGKKRRGGGERKTKDSCFASSLLLFIFFLWVCLCPRWGFPTPESYF